jgi:endonuclease G
MRFHHNVFFPMSGRGKKRSASPAKATTAKVHARGSGSGYNSSHLKISVPLPTLTGGDIAKLQYTHLTVLLNTTRRLSACSAFNLDVQSEATGKSKRDFHLDSRQPDAVQTDEKFYKNNPWDQGHLAALDFVKWGSLEEQLQAEFDSCTYANIAPQHENMHRLHGGEWTKMEAKVKKLAANFQAQGGLLSGFAGCVFGDDDYELRVKGDSIQVPKFFWFVAVWVSARYGTLQVGAFVIQNYAGDNGTIADDNPTDVFSESQSACSITSIEQWTGLKFPKVIKDADTYDSRRPS